MEKKKYQQAIRDLKKAWIVFCAATNERAYRNKNDLEQDTEEIGNALYTTLDKLSLHLDGEYDIPSRSKEEQLGSKMTRLANAIQNGKCSIDSEVADKFLNAIDMFDLAREAKEAGKTAALKDKYKNI